MKKSLLFVMPSLSAGGGEKSLVNLLSQLDYDLYNVDLLLLHKNGVFENLIPKQVNIIDPTGEYRTFVSPLNHSINTFIKNKKIKLAYARVMFSIKNRIIRNSSKAEQYSWRYLSQSLNILEKEYDDAIGYLEKSSIYFIVDKVKAKKKIGWVHTNYSNSGMDRNFDELYFEKLDHIVTVSEECAKSLKENFSHLANRIKVIYNIVSPTIIKRLSNKYIEDPFSSDHNEINIVTMARLSYEKGIDLAVKSCEKLVRKGYNIKWYVMGDGGERNKLNNIISVKNLKANFILLGIKENPYPYLKMADIYVQPSRYEGKSIAIDEAKILKKPIVVTSFNTAKDQINNRIDGLIVDMNSNAIAEGVEKLIVDKGVKQVLIHNLSLLNLGTEKEIEKLYKII